MNRSENIGELVAALAKAQAEFGSAIKESINPAFKSRYADLAANIGAVRPALNKNGIALMQFDQADLERQTASVTTALHHGEQFISITAEAPATGRNGFDVQSIGSAWTYLRRYTLQAICGLASEDDDGETLAGADNKPVQSRTPVAPVQPPRPPTTQSLTAAPQASPDQAQEGSFNLVGELLECVIRGVTPKTTKAGKPYLTVVWNGRIGSEKKGEGLNYGFCYHQSLVDAINAAIGKPCILKLKEKRTPPVPQFPNGSIECYYIEDVLYVDGCDYENGKPKPKTLTEELLNPFSEEIPS